MQAEQKRRFEEWKKLENPKYQPADDSMQDRRDWMVWSAALSTSPQGWQSIRSAPKDGTHILATLPDRDTCYVICWADVARDIRRHLGSPNVGWHMAYDGDFLQPHDAPTHWQPLPAPPEQGSKG